MILSVCLFVAALIMLWAAPEVLARGTWQVAKPRTALTLWFLAFFAGVGLATLGGTHSINNGAHLLAEWVADDGVRPGIGETIAHMLLCILSLVIVIVGIILVIKAAKPLAESHRRSVEQLAPATTSREDRGSYTLVRVDTEELVAFASPGDKPEIYLANSLERELEPGELQAVIAHEQAHLRYQHGLPVRIAEINQMCLPPGFRAGRELRRATLLLIELFADDVAARQTGSEQLANALSKLHDLTGDASLALRAERLRLRATEAASGS